MIHGLYMMQGDEKSDHGNSALNFPLLGAVNVSPLPHISRFVGNRFPNRPSTGLGYQSFDLGKADPLFFLFRPCTLPR